MRTRVLGALACLALIAAAALPQPAQADLTGGALKPDVRLLIDISGSMKQSDPDNLRGPALELIVRLLPDGARAGVWTFGEKVDVLVPHAVVDAAWRALAERAVASIDNSGQRTNIPAALEAATYDLGSIDPRYRVSLVLLTDGRVDVSASPMANAEAARRLLEDSAPELGATGIPVHTVALSEDADWTFLRSLARSTDGVAEKAENPAELTSIYLHALEMVAPSATVPVTESQFQIDDSVEEFTALVFFGGERREVTLANPAGEALPPGEAGQGVDWFINEQFVLVTVSDPAPGSWQIQAPRSARIRVTVISDLELEVDPMPNNLQAGRSAELGLRLREEGRVISDPELLSLFDLEVDIEGPGNTSRHIDVGASYPAPADGEYRVTVDGFERPGRYEVVARLVGETLEREMRMYVEVAPVGTTSISTRVQELPEDDLTGTVAAVALAVVALALVIHLILRRRRARRLAVWQRRARANAGEATEGGALDGLSADAGERQGPP